MSLHDPFHEHVYLREPASGDAAANEPCLRRGQPNRVTLRRSGRIAVSLGRDQMERSRKHGYPKIRLASGGGILLDDPSWWFDDERRALLLDHIPPGRHKLRMDRFGPYLSWESEELDVQPSRTVSIEKVDLTEGATVVVLAYEQVALKNAGLHSHCTFRGTTGEARGSEIDGAWIDEGYLLEGIPPGAGTITITTPDHDDITTVVESLKLGELRRVVIP